MHNRDFYSNICESLVNYIDSNGLVLPERYNNFDVINGASAGLCVFCNEFSEGKYSIFMESSTNPEDRCDVGVCHHCNEFLQKVYVSDWVCSERLRYYLESNDLYGEDVHQYFYNGGPYKDNCIFCDDKLANKYSGHEIEVCSDNHDYIGITVSMCDRCCFHIEVHEDISKPKRLIDHCGSCHGEMDVMSHEFYRRRVEGTSGKHTCNQCILNDKYVDVADTGFVEAKPRRSCINCKQRYTEFKSLYYGNNPFYNTIGKCPDCHLMGDSSNNIIALKILYKEYPLFLDLIRINDEWTYRIRSTSNRIWYRHESERFSDIGVATLIGMEKIKEYETNSNE